MHSVFPVFNMFKNIFLFTDYLFSIVYFKDLGTFNTVKLHINIPLVCLVFIPVSPLVMCRVLLQCQVCCCNLCIYCCVSWVWWKLAGSWFSGQRMCLFLERWIPMRRSWEELQETGSSWRTDFDLLSLRFQTVCVKIPFLLSHHSGVPSN